MHTDGESHIPSYPADMRTQISDSSKHSGGPPEDGREKRRKHVGVLYLQTRF
jgi:hypothetical protein